MASTTSTPLEFAGFTLRGIGRDIYRRFRDEPAHAGYRMTYEGGDLTIESPSFDEEDLTLRNVEWETYEDLCTDPDNDDLRMMYLDGELTIMSPLLRHDNRSRKLLYLVTATARAWRIEFMMIGTTTLRREGRARMRGAGKEADEGFYLGGDVARIGDKEDLDLAVDPPPNLAIEVVNRVKAAVAFPAYARIGVPEIWVHRVRENSVWFGRLAGEGYEGVDRSLGLPRLTPSLVLQALDAAGGMTQLDWLDWLDAWARELPEPPAAGL